MPDALVVHRPDGGTPKQLVLLFHGVGSDPRSLVPLGRRLAREFPQAAITSVPGPVVSDLGQGLQWFSVRGVTEENRPARVAEAMPRFVEAVQQQQAAAGVGPEQTILVGFSQGAIMALDSARLGHRLAARIVALAGRFSEPPAAVPAGIAFHLLHGADDPVIPARQCEQAAQVLAALGAQVTADVLPATGHAIPPAMEELLARRLAATPTPR
jgi:phospholipase/carboxylesterase